MSYAFREKRQHLSGISVVSSRLCEIAERIDETLIGKEGEERFS
jgi:hypothetical protein